MDKWYKIHLTTDQLMDKAYWNIHCRFATDKSRAGRQQGFAIFESANEDGVRSQTLFLPPQAAILCHDLLVDYSATACDKPDADSLARMPMLGDTRDFEFWFG
jgi:hypothetical protein